MSETITGEVVETKKVEYRAGMDSEYYTCREAFEVDQPGTYKLERVDE